jgi:hypothetical protein
MYLLDTLDNPFQQGREKALEFVKDKVDKLPLVELIRASITVRFKTLHFLDP